MTTDLVRGDIGVQVAILGRIHRVDGDKEVTVNVYLVPGAVFGTQELGAGAVAGIGSRDEREAALVIAAAVGVSPSPASTARVSGKNFRFHL